VLVSFLELGQVIVISKLCSHYFHRECLLVWLEKKDLCPYCRQPMWIQAQYDDCKAELMAVTNCDDPITSCEELQSNTTPEEILPQNQV
jgi:Ring finger domain